SVSLSPSAALVYKVTPATGMNLIPTVAGSLVDSVDVSWAENQIEKMNSLGVVNTKGGKAFAPQEKITRGEFAMFLIRTLGLSAQAGESFTDVIDSMPYAKEIAIGKALGILQGRGDGKYYPEEEISRQDLMVICARGMRLVKEIEGGDLSAFSDADLVADYARADIAAMVRAEIVKGNADGTVNPLGNTTRAEAAVIMSRILGWAA
ncbi:MAG: S-layer homology domain-containing protein, partial [Ruminococcaceae bacterium]|nr:S-layer homology domain-containing protein [Oscillospiraceae bacterium]